MQYEIKHRWTGAVLFTAALGAEYEAASDSVKLGATIKLAISARADLAGAHLAGANLAGADLADASLAGANFAGAYLAGANLTGADLTCAYLAHANLADANLARADLARANLVGANLVGANLVGANLARANLAGADLADANLAGADLTGADLTCAYLAHANGVIDAGTPNGCRAVGWRHAGTLRVRVGCRDFSIDEGREYWRGKTDRREIVAALDYIESVARLRGWPEAGETKQAA